MKDQENITSIEQFVIDFVRDLRNSKGLTQDGLASILRVGKSFVSNVESLNHRAKYNLNHINALADYYDMKPGDFLPAKPFPVNKKLEKANNIQPSKKQSTKTTSSQKGKGIRNRKTTTRKK